MDPLVDAFHQISPSDHSLDGLPFTVFLVGGAVSCPRPWRFDSPVRDRHFGFRCAAA